MALYIVVVLFIVAYGWFLRSTHTRDVLATPIFNHPICQNIDGWSISHFIFFGVLGLMYPGHHLQFFLVGFGWEVIETMLGQNQLEMSGKRVQLIGDQDEEGNTTGKNDAYWYGKESDVLCDALGYALGSAFAEKYWPNEFEHPKKAALRS
ncbi:MAG: hypothetical protein WC700_04220 [Gemmatimonadaceae bacterium]